MFLKFKKQNYSVFALFHPNLIFIKIQLKMLETTSDKIAKIGMMILFGIGALLVSGRYKIAFESYLNKKTHSWYYSPDHISFEVFLYYHLLYWVGIFLLMVALIRIVGLIKNGK